MRGLPVIPEAPQDTPFETAFKAAMDDDFNTPQALAVLFDLAREINRVRENDLNTASRLGTLLKTLGGLLGLLVEDPDNFLQNLRGQTLTREEIETLITEREQARAAKDWQTSDSIRQTLLAAGIVLEDTAKGTQWQVKG